MLLRNTFPFASSPHQSHQHSVSRRVSVECLHPTETQNQMLLSFSAPLLQFQSLTKSLTLPLILLLRRTSSTMSTRCQPHAFAGNPIRAKTPKSIDPLSPNSALETLKSALLSNINEPISPNFRVLPFRKGRPLAGSVGDPISSPRWHLGWLSLAECSALLTGSEVKLGEDSLVYLGCGEEEDVVYWAIDLSGDIKLVNELGKKDFSFVELRTLMVATDWADSRVMGELAVAGHAKALLEWHGSTRFCGQCGSKTIPKEAGRRMQCSNDFCKRRVYPRVDPVVIMLVIDKENDRALLSRQSRFVPRMWSCLAGFMEPGESLEEAVRRETWEETGIDVGEVIYHSSQPWPDAQWHSREDVKKALTFAEYKKAQTTASSKVAQMCKGVTQGQSLSADFNVESGELAPMFIPGPFAIAHHLISAWIDQGSVDCTQIKQTSSLSNL
ncbi:hypothetical protein V2J09_010299 [Rumex salicifolius]